MSTTSKYRCSDCTQTSWTTIEQGCKNCNSTNLEKVTKEEELAVKKEREKKSFVKNTLIALGIIAILLLTGILSITTEGCTLPIDLVLGNTCLFGSFGASLGATIAIFVLMAILGLIGKLLVYISRNS